MGGGLEEIADDIWIAEGEVVDFYGFPYPTRSVIVRFANGELWVWSPVALSNSLKAEISEIGEPRYLVSPNKIHHLYLQDWKIAYPAATIWGPQSTINKRHDLIFEAALEDCPPSQWQDELDQAWFKGSLLLDEIVFFHKKSQTAIIADMSENFTEEFLQSHWSGWKRRIAHLWGIVEGKGYAPLELRFSFLSRTSLRLARDKVLNWNPERVIMAHGKWQERGGKQYLQQAFGWIG